jgi:hypothetical protein
MSPDYVCDHHRNGVPFMQSTAPHCLVCPICRPEDVK